jgi:hypothetical protein
MNDIDAEKLYEEMNKRFKYLGVAGHDLSAGQRVTFDESGKLVATSQNDVGWDIEENVREGCLLALDVRENGLFAVPAKGPELKDGTDFRDALDQYDEEDHGPYEFDPNLD